MGSRRGERREALGAEAHVRGLNGAEAQVLGGLKVG